MKSIGIAAFTAAALGAGSACADATLVYRSTGLDAGVVETTLSVSRFFVRVDASDRENEYLLFQAGKYFPLYRVDTAAGQ